MNCNRVSIQTIINSYLFANRGINRYNLHCAYDKNPEAIPVNAENTNDKR